MSFTTRTYLNILALNNAHINFDMVYANVVV